MKKLKLAFLWPLFAIAGLYCGWAIWQLDPKWGFISLAISLVIACIFGWLISKTLNKTNDILVDLLTHNRKLREDLTKYLRL